MTTVATSTAPTGTPRLLDVLARLAAADPEHAALYDGRAGAAAGPRTLTRRELHQMAAGMAWDLRAVGVGAGDCLAVWLPNWSEAVAAQLAALSVGAHVVGINTRYNVDEVAHVLRTSTPTAVVIAHGFMGLDLLSRFDDARAQAGTAAPVMLVTPAPGADLPGDRDHPDPDHPDPGRYDRGRGARRFPSGGGRVDLTPHPGPHLATAFTTSGSTGAPKLAAHSEAGVSGHVAAVGERMGLHSGDVLLGALPLSGVFGFVAVFAALVSGAGVLLEPVFEPGTVLADMVDHGVTHIAAADDLIGRIAIAWEAERPRLGLRWIGIADFEGRSRSLAEWAEREFGTVVTGVYGSSELFSLITMWPADTPPPLRWLAGGQVVTPAIETRIVDPATGEVVPDGHEGEMQFRGPNVVDAYLGQPGHAGNMTADGWFRSGDLGRVVDRGGLQYVCRMGDALRLKGFLVDPAEIEARLADHSSVQLAKVVGIPGDTGGTVAVAFVVPTPGASPQERQLRAWCASTLAGFKVPGRVHVIDAMPTTSGTNGTKIRAAALRELAIERQHDQR